MRRFLVIAMLLPCLASAQSVSSVSGTIGDGESVTISGSSFGSTGPNIVLFENFSDGVDGTVCAPTTAPVGAWTEWNSNWPATYVLEANGNVCSRMVDEDVFRQARLLFDPVSEIFISFDSKVPVGGHFPNANAENTIRLGVNAIKMSWLLDGAGAESNNTINDLVVPNCNAGNWYFHSNVPGILGSSYEMGRTGAATQWWSFGNTRWNRMSSYFDLPAVGGAAAGTAWFIGMSEEYGLHEWTFENEVLSSYDNPTYDRIYFPGWIKTGDAESEMYYDNIYVATGDNARARIEVGDSAVYTDCTRLDICTPTSWSDTGITTTLRISKFLTTESAYVFVVDSSGNVSDGYGVVIGGSSIEEPGDMTGPTNLGAEILE